MGLSKMDKINERVISCRWLGEMIADEEKAAKEYGVVGLAIANDERGHKELLTRIKREMC